MKESIKQTIIKIFEIAKGMSLCSCSNEETNYIKHKIENSKLTVGTVIKWCNDNQGFLTAVLTVVSIFLSVMAIIVSIRTAKLPYRKKIRLSCSTDFFGNKETNKYNMGMSVNAVNVGSRDINITYIGLLNGNAFSKERVIRLNQNDTGIIKPTEIKTATFLLRELEEVLSKSEKSKNMYICVCDTEGKFINKKIVQTKTILKNLKEMEDQLNR